MQQHRDSSTTPAARRLSAGGIILSGALLALSLYVFVFDLIVIRGDSMLPVLRPDSLALVLRCAYGLRLPWRPQAYLLRWGEPQVGDIVVLDKPDGSATVKRVFEAGPAWLQSEDGFLTGRGGACPQPSGDVTLAGRATYVEPGCLFVVGENTGVSMDSRHYGAQPASQVRGRVILPRRTATGPGA